MWSSGDGPSLYPLTTPLSQTWYHSHRQDPQKMDIMQLGAFWTLYTPISTKFVTTRSTSGQNLFPSLMQSWRVLLMGPHVPGVAALLKPLQTYSIGSQCEASAQHRFEVWSLSLDGHNGCWQIFDSEGRSIAAIHPVTTEWDPQQRGHLCKVVNEAYLWEAVHPSQNISKRKLARVLEIHWNTLKKKKDKHRIHFGCWTMHPEAMCPGHIAASQPSW